MAIPGCFQLAETLFPLVRQEAARQLAGEGFSQAQIAAGIGISQAMVSRYIGREPNHDPLVLKLAREVVADFHGKPSGIHFCDLIEATPEHTLGVSEDMAAAENHLLHFGSAKIVPQVGMNLAVAVAGAETSQQVLSFPARLVADGDTLICPLPARWGASNHLANCILGIPEVAAIANIKPLGWDAYQIPRIGSEDAVPRVRKAIMDGHRLILDPGAIGIEPSLYVVGQSALQVVHKIIQLQEENE